MSRDSTTGKIPCYYFFDTNQIMLKECFELSLAHAMPTIELHPIEFTYKSSSSNFGTLDFRNLMLEKVCRVKDIIHSHIADGTKILISDIDIIVYKDFTHLLHLDDDMDILFQNERRTFKTNNINTGFIYLKCNTATYNLWAQVEHQMKTFNAEKFVNEQAIINLIISSHPVRWALFDNSIWAFSNLPKPATIYLHHANDTCPKPNKTSLQLKCMQMVYFLHKSSLDIKFVLIEKLRHHL